MEIEMSHNLHSNHRIRGINAAIVSMMLHSRVCHITLRMNFNLTQHWFSLDTKPKECSTTRFPVTVDMYERAIEHKTTASVWGCCLNNIICFRPNRSTTIMMFVTRRLVEKLGGSSYSFCIKEKTIDHLQIARKYPSPRALQWFLAASQRNQSCLAAGRSLRATQLCCVGSLQRLSSFSTSGKLLS